MWRPPLLVLSFNLALKGIGTTAMLAAIGTCYLDFATNDFRAVLTIGFFFWLLGAVAQLVVRYLNREKGLSLLEFWLPTVWVWAELLRRGPFVFFGVNW